MFRSMTQRYLYTQLLLGIICFFCLFAAKAQSDYLPQTIILKVKETYRDKCAKTAINHPIFTQLLNEIGVKKMGKMFPAKHQEKKKGNMDLSLIYELTYTNNISVDAVVNKLKKLPIVEYAQPHYLPQLAYSPSDTNISKQYFLALIDAFNAWDINKGDTNITIGITDTGWDTAHLDLKGNVRINYADPINGVDDDLDGYIDNYIGWDFGMNDNNALFESTSHGVYVSGFAAAVTDNVVGIAGVGFNTKFLPIKISNAAGQLTHAYEGVVYAADHGCFVINCSWGGFTSGQFEKEVIDYAIKNKGCVVVGAAGNNDADILFYPAAYPGVLSVSATEESDFKKNTSNYGYYVDISAPGENMYGTAGNNSYGINGGTSMAAPLVSGAVALVKAQFPAYNNQQVAAVLKATTDDLNALNPTYADKLGSGRLNLFKALSTTTPQFVELTSDSIFDNNNNTLTGGDTLNIIGFFTNYLSPVSTLTITLSSTSPYVNIIDGLTSLPPLNMSDTASNNTDPFLVEILNGAATNEKITFKLNITDTTYSRNEYLTITINPDHINVAINEIATTITSRGKIGWKSVV